MSAGPVLAPRTRDELAGVVRDAARDRAPVVVTGAATLPPDAPPGARVISTHLLNRVVAHEPGDLTLTVESGLVVGAAQQLLAAHGQFLALDRAASSIGGTIASGGDGPLASRFGRVRDQVLGLVVVNGDGRVTHCGGRVVKNVTGYDLCRLYTGSGGGLGIIVEATLRVRPLPERTRSFEAVFPDEAAVFARAFAIRDRVPEIACVRIRRERGAPGLVLNAIAAGMAPFVDAAVREVRAIAETPGSEADCDPRAIGQDDPPGGHTVVEIAAPVASWPGVASEIAELISAPVAWSHDVLRGVRTSWHEPGTPVSRDEARLDAVLRRLGAAIDCPLDPRFRATVMARFPSQTPGGLAQMRSLKSALDPAGILNAGMNAWG